MLTRYDRKINREVVNIIAGELYSTKKGEIISTLLGSCVSACIIDMHNNIAGMNHFMLPGNINNEEIFASKNAIYGIYAMELLINSMIKKGAQKKYFKAKVFGGGKIIDIGESRRNVSDDNIKFVRSFFDLEQIPIVTEDLGGTHGRRVYFFTETFDVYVKKIGSTTLSDVIRAEELYKAQITNKKDSTPSQLTLFD